MRLLIEIDGETPHRPLFERKSSFFSIRSGFLGCASMIVRTLSVLEVISLWLEVYDAPNVLQNVHGITFSNDS